MKRKLMIKFNPDELKVAETGAHLTKLDLKEFCLSAIIHTSMSLIDRARKMQEEKRREENEQLTNNQKEPSDNGTPPSEVMAGMDNTSESNKNSESPSVQGEESGSST